MVARGGSGRLGEARDGSGWLGMQARDRPDLALDGSEWHARACARARVRARARASASAAAVT
eukprot:4025918-Prymnesium_polylepis.1